MQGVSISQLVKLGHHRVAECEREVGGLRLWPASPPHQIATDRGEDLAHRVRRVIDLHVAQEERDPHGGRLVRLHRHQLCPRPQGTRTRRFSVMAR
jgi:hypothetical protein